MKNYRILWLGALALLTIHFHAGSALAHDDHSHGSAVGALASGCDLTNPTNLVQWLIPFQDRMPVPPVMRPARTNFNYRVPVAPQLHFTNGIPEYDVSMTVVTNHSFHSSLPGVDVWGYNGSSPGPTFDVVTNSPILVNWINKLPSTYPPWLPVDTNLHGVDDTTVRTVVHLHGSASLPRYDGWPTNWFRTGQSDQYFYSNQNFSGSGATLWYHDHAVGVTGNNVYAGLAGYYLLRNPTLEASLNLPKGAYEIPLVFQDKDISTNCSPPSLAPGPFPWHNLAVVNGKVTPYFEVEPRKYRFRILNGAGYRTFGLAFAITDLNGIPLPNNPAAPLIPPTFYVIGNENGFLPSTVAAPPQAPFSGDTNNFNLGTGPILAMMPGERIDVIVDFAGYTNKNITLKNTLTLADPTNLVIGTITNAQGIVTPVINQISVTNLMQFRVNQPLSSIDTSSIPTTILTNWTATSNMVKQAAVTREITLDTAFESPFPGPPFSLVSGYPFALLDMKYFDDPIMEFPHPGDTEIWSIVNLSNEAHPIHIHLTDCRVIDRRRFSSGTPDGWDGDIRNPPLMITNYINDRIAGTLKNLSYYLSTNRGEPRLAADWEGGPKDTFRAAPFAVTRVVLHWPTDPIYYTTPSASSPLDQDTDGRYVYHCHILDHEDNDMMRPLQVMPKTLPSRGIKLRTLAGHAGHPGGGNQLTLGVETVAGETYYVESTTKLRPAIWLPVPTVKPARGTGGFVNFLLPFVTDRTMYYRIRTQPNP